MTIVAFSGEAELVGGFNACVAATALVVRASRVSMVTVRYFMTNSKRHNILDENGHGTTWARNFSNKQIWEQKTWTLASYKR